MGGGNKAKSTREYGGKEGEEIKRPYLSNMIIPFLYADSYFYCLFHETCRDNHGIYLP